MDAVLTTRSDGGASLVRDADAHAVTDYLAFRLGADECCIDFAYVQELVAYQSIAGTSEPVGAVCSTLDFHGDRMTLVDMRSEANLRSPHGLESAMLVVLALAEGPAGMVVDSVSGVCRIRADQIGPVPAVPALANIDYFTGLARCDGQLLVIVDIEKFLTRIAGHTVGDPSMEAALA